MRLFLSDNCFLFVPNTVWSLSPLSLSTFDCIASTVVIWEYSVVHHCHHVLVIVVESANLTLSYRPWVQHAVRSTQQLQFLVIVGSWPAAAFFPQYMVTKLDKFKSWINFRSLVAAFSALSCICLRSSVPLWPYAWAPGSAARFVSSFHLEQLRFN